MMNQVECPFCRGYFKSEQGLHIHIANQHPSQRTYMRSGIKHDILPKRAVTAFSLSNTHKLYLEENSEPKRRTKLLEAILEDFLDVVEIEEINTKTVPTSFYLKKKTKKRMEDLIANSWFTSKAQIARIAIYGHIKRKEGVE